MSGKHKNMKRLMMILMAVALVVLPTMAQSFGQQERQNTAFQSTSTMQSSGSVYSSNPSLNSDGTAYSPASERLGGPRKAPTPVSTDEYWEANKSQLGSGLNPPLGDAVLPLMLMALAYLGVRFFRARKRALKG